MNCLTYLLISALPLAPAEADELLPWLQRSNGVYSAHEAAAAGDMNALRVAVTDKSTLNMPDELGNTPLDLAVAAGHVAAVNHLIGEGATATERTLSLAQSPAVQHAVQGALSLRRQELRLCEHVAGGQVAQVRKLMALGVDPNCLTHDHQMSVLMQAARDGKVEIVQILLESGANPDYVNPQTKSVLHVAAADGTPEVVTALLEGGANPMARGSNAATPLHDAVWERNAATVKALLPAYRAQNYNPDGGRNGLPLIMAIQGGNKEIVQAFIEAGTDLRHPMFRKVPPLTVAVQYRREPIARMLLAAGADPDAQDEKGKSARDYAAEMMPQLFE